MTATTAARFWALSAAYLVQGDYAGSMKYAKLADSPYRYNRAFEGYRQEWLTRARQDVVIVLVLLVAQALLYIWPRSSYKRLSADTTSPTQSHQRGGMSRYDGLNQP